MERDIINEQPTADVQDFNSHAHVERDGSRLAIQFDIAISTHTLTWSVTPFKMPLRIFAPISTHTLTWSVTRWVHRIESTRCNFNSHAHVERDAEAWIGLAKTGNFNSHAHVERDLENAPTCHGKQVISTHTLTWSVTSSQNSVISADKNFNSHAHVERDQGCDCFSVYLFKFQLTRSRGAWPKVLLIFFPAPSFQLTRSRGAWHSRKYHSCHLIDFNSHAHVERDSRKACRSGFVRVFQLTRSRGAWPDSLTENLPALVISTHTLTWSVTIFKITTLIYPKFQLTRSRGAWRGVADITQYTATISTHTLTWSVTAVNDLNQNKIKFQLTRSRGAWLCPYR